MNGTFDWDPRKSEENRRKHGVRFDEARTVFNDPYMQIVFDLSHSDQEDRFVALGRSVLDRLLVVVHVYRGDTIRLISARRATRSEQARYED